MIIFAHIFILEFNQFEFVHYKKNINLIFIVIFIKYYYINID